MLIFGISTPPMDYNCRIGGVFMKKLLFILAASVFLGAVLFIPAQGQRAENFREIAVAGNMEAANLQVRYAGGTAFQRRLAGWYNLNLSSQNPDAGFREAYLSVLSSEDGVMGYILLPEGKLAFPILHEGEEHKAYCFFHQSASAFPLGRPEERTVLLWQTAEAEPDELVDFLGLYPGSRFEILMLDCKIPYEVQSVSTDAAEDSACCLVFLDEDGSRVVVSCRCIG